MTEIIFCWRNGRLYFAGVMTDYIVVEGGLRLYFAGGVIYIVVGRLTEITLR